MFLYLFCERNPSPKGTLHCSKAGQIRILLLELQRKLRHFESSFYPTVEQLGNLYDMAHAHKKLTGQRLNRNDIVRYLIDQATLIHSVASKAI
jgi:hypothetical protein